MIAIPGIVSIGVIFATLHAIAVNAQTLPLVLPGNWTSFGCYTDVSTSRALAASSFVSDNLTIESCIAYCGEQDYIFAGVEFANCDSTLQYPSIMAPLENCNFACTGAPNETCGGSNRLNVFWSGEPLPTIVETIPNTQGSGQGQWEFQGCFTDSTSARTLIVPVNIPGGVTPQSCTAACQALGGYTLAGTEIGHECWCDNSFSTEAAAQHVSDSDCRMVCDSEHEFYCGNIDRVQIYRFNPNGGPGGGNSSTSTCKAISEGNFTLQAVFKDPQAQPPTVPLKVIVVEMVKSLTWTILSACPNCCSEWPTFGLFNSVVQPRSIVDPTISMTNFVPVDGESPTFVASSPPFPGSQSYCVVADPAAAANANAPPLLAFQGKADAFSLCKNSTAGANGRMDVVFSPATGHPHYDVVNDCTSIYIQVISS